MQTQIDSLKQKIHKNPNTMENYTTLGGIYEQQRMFQQAIDECYMNILKYQPYNGVILNQIGVCYFCLANYTKAITFFKKVIEIKEIGDVYRNIAACYISLKLYKKAEKNCILAYNLEPWHDANKSSLAELYYYYKQYDRSIEFYRKIKTIDDSFKYGYNIAFPYLGKRDFTTGFHYYEFRLKENNINPQTGMVERLELPQIQNWNGSTDCNHLLLIYEQGIGDNIQYYRFAIQLAQQNPHMKITYFCKNTIAHLLNNTANGVSNIDIVLNLPHLNFDYKAYMMSLPYLLKLDTITPNTYDYIKIDAYKTAEWRQKLSPLRKFRVGFTYNGLFSSFMEAVRALHPNSKALKSAAPVTQARKDFPNLYDTYKKAGLAMAKGGIVTSPTQILAGESGAEAIIPLDRFGGLGGQTINVTINAGIGTDASAVGDEIVNVLQRYNRRNGALPLKVA